MKEKDLQEYCCGCGLCHSENGTKMVQDANGFGVAEVGSSDADFCRQVCPAAGAEEYLQEGPWGTIQEVYGGWSTDEAIRHAASSGGVLTSLAMWLLEAKIVDGVIQTKAADGDPIATQTVCSVTPQQVKECLGSRYTASSPLTNLSELMEPGKKYAVIGRPCDILALEKYREATGRYADEIVCTLAFFCAGTPSRAANQRLLEALHCPGDKLGDFTYRGNGWPGYMTATDTDGKTYQMPYAQGWSRYLGRELRPICRFCMDGTGAAADISCGDYWQLQDGKPLFTEAEGRNLIFARTEKGHELLRQCRDAGAIHLCQFAEGREQIHLVQPAQFERVTTMRARVMAMKLCGRSVPAMDKVLLRRFARQSPLKKRGKIFLGTVKRIRAGKI